MQFSVNSLLTELQIRYEIPGRSLVPFPSVQNNLHQNHPGPAGTKLPYSEHLPRENKSLCAEAWNSRLGALPLGNVPLRLNSLRPFCHQYLIPRCWSFSNPPRLWRILLGYCAMGIQSLRSWLDPRQRAPLTFLLPGCSYKIFRRQLKSYKRFPDLFQVVCQQWKHLKSMALFLSLCTRAALLHHSQLRKEMKLLYSPTNLLFPPGPLPCWAAGKFRLVK